MKRKAKYGEGDWFSVPLRTGGFGLGLVARASSSGILLGYFFGVRSSEQPSSEDCVGLTQADAILVARFGDLGLKQGDWRVIGPAREWERRKWPVPIFMRAEQLSGRTYEVFYDDNDPGLLLGERLVPSNAPDRGLPDGLLGAGAVEKALTRLLG